MRRLVFYEDPNADPLVETGSVLCGDAASMIDTATGPVRADALVVGNLYRWPDGTCSRIDAIEEV